MTSDGWIERRSSTESALFGAVGNQSPITAVARRLRVAIGLGLLSDGDRLPREADLVRRLGVTAFAMREALGLLRSEGLITTRAGKNGGSFVSYGTDRALLTSGELRRMSATELRDLGDWRQMLASVSAALAAQRASTSNIDRLRGFADALEAAETELEARRAHGRFHIELAAAAQSMRMTRAELAMYEEFDWLLGVTLADQRYRHESAHQLRTIAHAVAARQPEAARAAAVRHSASMVDALVRHRLVVIAATERRERSDRGSIATSLIEMLSSIERCLTHLAAQAEAAVTDRVDEGELRKRLSRAVIAGLADFELALDGIGFLAAPGTVPGAEYCIPWWRPTADGVVANDHHIVDPTRDDFYDYASQEYFTVPRRQDGLFAQGPYVDYGGANDYVITFSMPVLANGAFVGVAAADMPIAAIERRVASHLASNGAPSVLVNAERRAIVGNVADHQVGDVLRPDAHERVDAVGRLGWSVVSRKTA